MPSNISTAWRDTVVVTTFDPWVKTSRVRLEAVSCRVNKSFTHEWLYHRAYHQRTVTLCGWEGDRRSGVADLLLCLPTCSTTCELRQNVEHALHVH